ncbi:hypothetical protein NDN08_003254 [Rhodosorus marinus]|uniref:Sulfotransferase domain-containing protein n=1 Tax=Rhodosorus marinus TaxID=101924 RepID=A0AAV8UYS8_9RHOD|nr:hypothetical protein NDN08_003254 [Rhodosorus marinus]
MKGNSGKATGRRRAIFLLAGLALVLIFAVVALTKSLQPAARAVRSTFGSPDFCDYLNEDLGELEPFDWNIYPRPIIDPVNKLYICVTPKSGITKMQYEYRNFMSRHKGYTVPSNEQNRQADQFEKDFGPFKQSFPTTNYTKIFVYRNPLDRLISLYLHKFTPKFYSRSWISQAFIWDYRIPSFELFLKNLALYIDVRGLKDPHGWPQVPYCQVDKVKYDHIVDIDDHSTLQRLFGSWWGDEQVDFESSTFHATKSSVSNLQRDELRHKIHLWRREFYQTYGKDIKFYCIDRGMANDRNRHR